ncbi:MAG: thiamine phosphate synthase [Capsulimonadaceae bacterium]
MWTRPRLMLVTEPGPRLVEIVHAAVDGGVDIVQWRDKTSTVNDLEQVIARDLLPAIRDRALTVANFETPERSAMMRIFSNGATGIHLPEAAAWGKYDLGMFTRDGRLAASGVGDGMIGRSIHSVENAMRAEKAGADYVVAGTIFASPSHPDTPPAGLDFLAAVCSAVSIPVIAIGGITPENVSECLRAGARGVAVLSRIMRAVDPRAAALAYRRGLDRAAGGT